MLNQIILLCRPGFEKECAGEIMEKVNQQPLPEPFPAYIQTREQTAFVQLISSTQTPATNLILTLPFRQLIFARQWFAAPTEILELPEKNRLPDILKLVKHINEESGNKCFNDIEMSYADTNEGKSLSKFCKQFKPHLLTAMKKKQLLSAHSGWHLHLFFIDSLHVYIGISPVENSAADAMGIPRLRMPSSAPSRSTLKLEEAIHWFLQTEQDKYIRSGMTAVDLGAAPGGWSWQLVQRSCLVTAIDNGPMQDALMRTGMVEHYQTDAFTYTPKQQVDWLVCDMAERPLHVSRLIARWFTGQHCKNAIFNLKLPMKKRLLCVNECIALLDEKLRQANIAHTLLAKHLYHDREEITVCILTQADT